MKIARTVDQKIPYAGSVRRSKWTLREIEEAQARKKGDMIVIGGGGLAHHKMSSFAEAFMVGYPETLQISLLHQIYRDGPMPHAFKKMV